MAGMRGGTGGDAVEVGCDGDVADMTEVEWV